MPWDSEGTDSSPPRPLRRPVRVRSRLIVLGVFALLAFDAVIIGFPGRSDPCPSTAWPRRVPHAQATAAGDHYVAETGDDAGPGTREQPWRTLQHAADAAGGTVWIRSGSYSGFRLSRSGLSFRGDGTGSVIVDGGLNGARDSIVLTDAAEVVVADLTVRGAAENGAGIRVRNSDGVTLERVRACGNASFGIRLEDAPNSLVRDGEVTGNAEGIYVAGSAAGTRIVGNEIHDNARMIIDTAEPKGDDHGAVGVAFAHSTGPTIATGNQLWRNRAPSHDYGYDGSAFEIFGASDVTISDNRMWDNKQVIETGTDGPPCARNVIARNVAWAASSVAGYTRGLLFACMSDSTVANNVLHDFDISAVSVVNSDIDRYRGPLDGLRILNNILVSDGASVYYLDQPPPTLTIDHNLVWSRSPGSLAYSVQHGSTADPQELRAWYGFDASSRWGNPRFRDVDHQDYRPRDDSPAIDGGTTVTGVTEGYRGAAPDIGAVEVR